MNLNLQPRERIFIVISLLATAYCFNHFFYQAKKAEITSIKANISNLNAKIMTDKAEVEKLELLNQKANIRQAQNNKENSLIKANKSITKLLEKISLSGPKAPVQVKRIFVLNRAAKPEYTKTVFSLEIESSFLSLGKFLEKLENSPFLIDIKKVNITHFDDDLRLCVGNIELHSYVINSGGS